MKETKGLPLPTTGTPGTTPGTIPGTGTQIPPPPGLTTTGTTPHIKTPGQGIEVTPPTGAPEIPPITEIPPSTEIDQPPLHTGHLTETGKALILIIDQAHLGAKIPTGRK